MYQKFLKLLKSDTSRDSLFSVSGQGVAALAGFGFFALAANAVTLAEFGYFSLALATAAIVKDIIDPALNATLVKFIPQGKLSAQHITRYVIQIKFLYFALVLGIVFLIPSFLSRLLFNTDWAFLMIMTITTSAVLSVGSMVSGFLQGHRQFATDAAFVVAQPVVRLIFFGIAMYLGYMGVIELLVINALAYLAAILMFAWVITYDYITGDIPPLSKKSANIFLGPLAVSAITGTLLDRIGLFITNYFLGPAAVGLLSAVMRLFIPAQQIAGVLNSVLGTRFASFQTDNQAQTYLKQALILISPIALAAIATMPFAPLILRLFGEEYVAGVGILRIITLGFVGFLFQVPFVAKLVFYKNRSDALVWISLLQLGLILTLQFCLIYFYGLTGAAIGISLTMLTIFCIYILSANKLPKRKLSS